MTKLTMIVNNVELAKVETTRAIAAATDALRKMAITPLRSSNRNPCEKIVSLIDDNCSAVG